MIRVQDWIASIPEEEKHIAYVGEGKSERREFLLCGDGWEAYKNHNFHLDMAFDFESITTRDHREVEQTTVNSTKHTEEADVSTEEVTTKETYSVDSKRVLNYDETDIAPLSKAVEKEGIRLTWTVLNQHTQLPGKLWANIRAVGEDATQIKKSAIMVFEVDASVKATPASTPPVSEFVQMEAEMDSLRQQAYDSADEAMRHSVSATMAADAARNSMQAAQEADRSAVTAASTATQAAAEAANAAVTAVDQAKRAECFHTQSVSAAETATAAADAAGNAAASAAITLERGQLAQNTAEQAAKRAETAAQTCEAVTIHDDGNGNVAITVAAPTDSGDTPLVPHSVSGTVVTVDDTGAVNLPLEITANDTATKVFVGGKNFLPAENGTVVVESTYKRVYFPMTMPAGTYRIAATVTSDVPDCDRATVQFYHGTTLASDGFSLYTNTGTRVNSVVIAKEPFDNVALFSGHGAGVSSGYGATYRELTVTLATEEQPAYEAYRGQALSLPVSDLVVEALPTVVMADAGDVSVTYYTEMLTESDQPTADGGPLQSLTVNGRQYALNTDETGTDTKKWADKTWVCVGDSLTQKMQHSEACYYEYVAEETGISVVNMGQGGTGYKKQEENNAAFYQRIHNVPANADVVTIFGSGNDVAGFHSLQPTAEDFVSYLGTETDTGTDTICGCINTTIDNLYAKYPTIRLGIVSPTPWRYNGPTFSCTMGAYSDRLKAICHRRGIPFLDLFHSSGFRNEDEAYRNTVFTGDATGAATHPNAVGHALIAPRFRAFLETLL